MYSRRRRLQWNRVLFVACALLVCTAYQLHGKWMVSEPWTAPRTAAGADHSQGVVFHLSTRQLNESTVDSNSTEQDPKGKMTAKPNIRHCIIVDPSPTVPPTKPVVPPALQPVNNTNATDLNSAQGPSAHRNKGEYPEDLFTIEQRRRGWVVLHIFGMVYVFVALAIVCDEYFVPSLGVITDKLQISDDVAGATFMAAGGSAPELFTSLIGVFISHSNVGIGTIVGSAVFNILFVIGMCALFSREILNLTWWPLFRDVSFYILDLVMLIVFFLDNFIAWWESILLLSGYGCYVCFMKCNVQLERWIKTQLAKRQNLVKVMALDVTDKKINGSIPGDEQRLEDDSNRLKPKPVLQRGGSSASLHNSTIRNTIFQLMIHTLDPLGEVKFKDKAEIMSSMAKAKVKAREGDKKGEEREEKTELPNTVNVQVTPPTESSSSPQNDDEGKKRKEKEGNQKSEEVEDSSDDSSETSDDSDDDDDDDDTDDESDEESDIAAGEDNDEPLSLEWPDTRRKQATYLFLLPIVFPLWLTVPDVRNPPSRKFFVVTFFGSIIWIAAFSYLMVWWAHQVGETVGISEEIMGLTILAAGTSIPDLITSVIVARKGLGDMAVSSSVGSNIFDITVGLPVPWLLFSTFNKLSPVAVSSNGLFCAIVLLFLMLLFVIISIAVSQWRMNKTLGFTMFGLYFVFLVVSVMLEDRIIICPVSI
ncbi:sodium/potassium/calcium exchanger 1-like [Protopterus annectens]|uniref:sodium/potassium/calcium exchanger 1-like n=1 Tax=Protopterus annectens TaxID=7888 RepID=UPI001CF9D9E7|nr:sodium/potassium/calcium exchanger 1-like [Protopterus annectens]XP_043933917.1 sodium/potassium/calcium exchanger 1-like [Protopterus annectens]